MRMRTYLVVLSVIGTCAVSIAGFSTTGVNAVSEKAVSAVPQATPEKPLNEEEVGALLEALGNGLPDLIDDERSITAIEKKWSKHKDLVGKTGMQILKLLFADVKLVVKDKETQDAIWSNWTEADDDRNQEIVPVAPTPQPVNPDVQATPVSPIPSERLTGTMTGTVMSLNRSKQYGYIMAENGTKYFFRFSSLNGISGENLREGQAVTFEAKQIKDSFIAVTVRPA
jgi:cold shock CspA family protein